MLSLYCPRGTDGSSADESKWRSEPSSAGTPGGAGADVEDVPRHFAAGGDLITSQSLEPAEQMAAAVLAKAEGDSAFRATVDAAARQVLTAKRAAGLLPC